MTLPEFCPTEPAVKRGVLPTIDKVREALIAAEPDYLAVYKHTDLKPEWLRAFASDRIADPSYTRTATLVRYLVDMHPQVARLFL